MAVNVLSPDGSLDRGYVSNYALTQIRDRLTRVEGIGDVQIFGARDYAMRVWIDPGRAATLGLTAGEVVGALRSQNVQVAAGVVGQPPYDTGAAQQLNVETQGRFKTADEFAQHRHPHRPDDRRDHPAARRCAGRARRRGLWRQRLSVRHGLASSSASPSGPGTNALAAAEGVKARARRCRQDFPQGLEYRIIWNPTEFISESMSAVQETLLEAMLLVVLVIIVFLQSWRAAIIPIVAIPVSLIGTFAVLAALGYSLNTLSMFGLVLAIGIVVDDAIVVVENVERNLEQGLSPREAAHRSMDEVSTALVAIVLVLCAVFVPITFLTGITGEFYRQFAVTIAAVDDHLAAPVADPVAGAGRAAAAAEERASRRKRRHGLRPSRRRLVQQRLRPPERLVRQLHPPAAQRAEARADDLRRPRRADRWASSGPRRAASSRRRTRAMRSPRSSFRPEARSSAPTRCSRRRSSRLLKVPGVDEAVMFSGFDGASGTQASNAGAAYVTFKPFEERAGTDRTEQNIENDMRAALADMDEAFVFVIPPPVIQGIGNGGGYRMIVQDRSDKGYQALEQAGRPADRRGAPGAGARQRLHPVQHGDAAHLCGHRPGQGRHARRSAGARVRGAAGLSRLGLRQRLQPARPHLSA